MCSRTPGACSTTFGRSRRNAKRRPHPHPPARLPPPPRREKGCARRPPGEAMNIDPITFAVIKSGLDSIADDMAYTVVRIARSEIVKDVMDFSAALCAADGQLVAH